MCVRACACMCMRICVCVWVWVECKHYPVLCEKLELLWTLYLLGIGWAWNPSLTDAEGTNAVILMPFDWILFISPHDAFPHWPHLVLVKNHGSWKRNPLRTEIKIQNLCPSSTPSHLGPSPYFYHSSRSCSPERALLLVAMCYLLLIWSSSSGFLWNSLQWCI